MRRHEPRERPERAGRARHPRQLPRALPQRRTRVRDPVAGARRDRVDRDRPRPLARPRRALGRQQLRLLRRTDAVQHPRRTALDLGPLRHRRQPRRHQGHLRPRGRHPLRRQLPPRTTAPRRRQPQPGDPRLQPLTGLRQRRPRARPPLRRPNHRRTRHHRRRGWLLGGGLDVPVGPANLRHVERLTAPRAFRALPAWAMAAGRDPQLVDARIHGNVVWILRRHHLRVTAARESGHQTHGDGTAVDLIPADGTTQPVWDASAGRLAQDLGWTPRCARQAPAPPARSCPRSSSSATTATPATAHPAPAPAPAPPTSTSPGTPAATAQAPSRHPASGSTPFQQRRRSGHLGTADNARSSTTAGSRSYRPAADLVTYSDENPSEIDRIGGHGAGVPKCRDHAYLQGETRLLVGSDCVPCRRPRVRSVHPLSGKSLQTDGFHEPLPRASRPRRRLFSWPVPNWFGESRL